MKRKIIVVLSAVLAVVIIMPILLDKFIFGNGYKSNISNSDWASFLGSYIGSIIGAIATLVGIVITILYTGKQNKIDRQLQFSPYLAATFKKVNTLLYTNGGTIQAVINESGPLNLYVCLSLKNVGLGPITYWKVKSSYYNPQDINGTNAIEQGKCLNLGIEMPLMWDLCQV